jgi:hypothetical protein
MMKSLIYLKKYTKTLLLSSALLTKFSDTYAAL